MAMITITGNSPEELKATFRSLFGLDPPAETPTTTAAAPATAPAATASEPAPESQKPKGSRRRAEAPAPLQPSAAIPSQPPPPAPLAQPAAQPSPTPFAPAAPASSIPSFSPLGNGAAPQPAQERIAVVKLRGQLNKLLAEHGESQVHNWLGKAFGLSSTVTVSEFMNSIIQQQSDSLLEQAYQLSGGT